MKLRLVDRSGAARLEPGLVLAQDVRGEQGRVVLDKGRVLSESDVRALRDLRWTELHLLALEPGDLHEDPAGRRLAQAAAGSRVGVGELSSGAWPLVARERGILELSTAELARVNAIEDLVVYTQPHRQIVLEGELVGRAKIVPFATAEANVREAEQVAGGAGLLRVRPFLEKRVHALVQESLDEPQLARFRRAFEDKLAFFGSTLAGVDVLPGSVAEVAQAFARAIAGGAQLIALAGSKPMDPFDLALQALGRVGARIESRGVPAHPGTLLWLAYLPAAAGSPEVPAVGMPSCGLFSKATVFDLLLPRLLAGERLSRRDLAEYGAGGLLTRDMAFRFPSYSPTRNRGELDGA
jgi:molybdopterin biosynthesis enzyme